MQRKRLDQHADLATCFSPLVLVVVGVAAKNSAKLVRYDSVGYSDASSPAINGATRPTSLSKLEILARILHSLAKAWRALRLLG